MEKKINIIEIIKDCPIGTKLYSPLCGECRILSIYDGLGFDVICGDNTVYNFSYDGRYNIMGECCIFPSKENRDWSKFKRPFKDGDIVVGKNCACDYIAIFKEFIDGTSFSHHMCLTNFGKFIIDNISDNANLRFATKEEKEKLFDAIKAKGYRWNAKTKTLEKLPKFKVGNRIKKCGYCCTIKEVREYHYLTKCGNLIAITDQDNWELVPKFDITNLKSFDKVLIRDKDTDEWNCQFFSYYYKNSDRPYVCIGCESLNEYKQCIPYEENKHLRGTSNDCDEYYKTW